MAPSGSCSSFRPFLPALLLLSFLLLLNTARLADASIVLHANDTDITLKTQNYFLASQDPIDRTGMLVELTLRDGCLTSPESTNASAVNDGTWTRVYNQTLIYASWGNAIRKGCDTYGQLTKVAQEYAASFSEAGLPPAKTLLILLGPRPERLEVTEGSPFLEGYAAHTPGIPDGPISSDWTVHLLGTVSSTKLVNHIRDATRSGKAAPCRLLYEAGPWNEAFQHVAFIAVAGFLATLAFVMGIVSFVGIFLSLRQRPTSLRDWTQLAILLAACALLIQAVSLEYPMGTLTQGLLERTVQILTNISFHLILLHWALSLPAMKSKIYVYSLVGLSAVLSTWLPAAGMAQLFMRAVLPPENNLGLADDILFGLQIFLGLAIATYSILIWKGYGTTPPTRKDGSLPAPYILSDSCKLSWSISTALTLHLLSAALTTRVIWPLTAVRPIASLLVYIASQLCTFFRLVMIVHQLDPLMTFSKRALGSEEGQVTMVGAPQSAGLWNGVDLWGSNESQKSKPSLSTDPDAWRKKGLGEEEEEDEADVLGELDAAAYLSGHRRSKEHHSARDSQQSAQWVAEEYTDESLLSSSGSYGGSRGSASSAEVGIGRRVSLGNNLQSSSGPNSPSPMVPRSAGALPISLVRRRSSATLTSTPVVHTMSPSAKR